MIKNIFKMILDILKKIEIIGKNYPQIKYFLFF